MAYKVSLKKCEKARNNYESCDAKVNQLNSKGKLNLLKVVEVRSYLPSRMITHACEKADGTSDSGGKGT